MSQHWKRNVLAAVRTLFSFESGAISDWRVAAAEAMRQVTQLDSVSWVRMAWSTDSPLADAWLDDVNLDLQPLLGRYIETYHQHPFTRQRVLANPKNGVLFTSDFPPGLSGTELHADVLGPLGINIQG